MEMELKRYRVWGETEISTVAPFYSGHIDVWAESEEAAAERAQQECRRAHSWRGMHITRIEIRIS